MFYAIFNRLYERFVNDIEIVFTDKNLEKSPSKTVVPAKDLVAPARLQVNSRAISDVLQGIRHACKQLGTKTARTRIHVLMLCRLAYLDRISFTCVAFGNMSFLRRVKRGLADNL